PPPWPWWCWARGAWPWSSITWACSGCAPSRSPPPVWAARCCWWPGWCCCAGESVAVGAGVGRFGGRGQQGRGGQGSGRRERGDRRLLPDVGRGALVGQDGEDGRGRLLEGPRRSLRARVEVAPAQHQAQR